MPTGYTAHIEKGTVKTPKDFLRICLRNFGICLPIRDNDDIPLSETDLLPYIKEEIQKEIDFYEERLKNSIAELNRFDKLSEEDLYEKWRDDLNAKRESYMKFFGEALHKNDLYAKFTSAIREWEPSYDFKNIKEFALNQIEISKDDDPDYWFRKANEVEEPTMANFIQKSDEIRAKYRDDLLASVNYNRETLEKKRKNLETAVSFYIRFEDDIKDIRD